MKKEHLLSWIFCFISLLGYAQQKQDYILTLQQDTLYGRILTKPYGLAPITFIYGRDRMTYHPSSIQFFGIYRDKEFCHFKTLRSDEGKAIFVQILLDKPLKLYKYKEEHLLINATLKRYVYFMGLTDDQLITLSSSNYQRILSNFLKEKPILLSKLANVSFGEVPQLLAQYPRISSTTSPK